MRITTIQVGKKHIAPTPVINNDWGEEGARPSSLIPYYHHKPDRAYLLQLKYAVEKANEEAVRLYGPLPPGGLPAQKKTKPKGLYRDPLGSGAPRVQQIIEENEMNLKQVATASILTVAGTLAAYRADGAAHENDKAIHALESGEIPQSRPALQSADPTQSQSEAVREHLAPNSAVPEGFLSYASVPIGGNLRCTAGAVTDEDGMNQRPYVYVDATSGKSVKWTKALDVPEGFYESRATHCLLKDGALYVLLQSDTQSQQTLSQTLLQIVKIDARDGTVEGSADVVIPGAKGAYSTWVKKGEENFRQVQDEVLITGEYRMVDTDETIPFHVSVKD